MAETRYIFFVAEMKSVYSAVRTGSLNKASAVKGLMQFIEVYILVLSGKNVEGSSQGLILRTVPAHA
jgi:hypothetical protein